MHEIYEFKGSHLYTGRLMHGLLALCKIAVEITTIQEYFADFFLEDYLENFKKKLHQKVAIL